MRHCWRCVSIHLLQIERARSTRDCLSFWLMPSMTMHPYNPMRWHRPTLTVVVLLKWGVRVRLYLTLAA
jgi:hypothetical protein